MSPDIRLLASGYWHVRWGTYVWAQWPRGRDCTPDDVRLGEQVGLRSLREQLSREANDLYRGPLGERAVFGRAP